MANTVTSKEVGSHWSEAFPLLPWEKRRSRDTRASLLLPLQADGRGDMAVNPRDSPLPASPSHGSSHPSRFLNVGIVQRCQSFAVPACPAPISICLFWLFLDSWVHGIKPEQIYDMRPVPLKLMVVLLHWLGYRGFDFHPCFHWEVLNGPQWQPRNSYLRPRLNLEAA